MKIDIDTWDRYIRKLRQINRKAAAEMEALVNRLRDRDNLERREEIIVDYAFKLVTRYGEAAGAAACEMYDAIAAASGFNIPPADPADVATFQETVKAIRGTIKNQSIDTVPSTVSRLVKQVSADTTLKNALRDGAEFAWIPRGDTCAFCIALASRGWQRASKKSIRNGHAEHIHANCDCTYAIRFDSNMEVEGYDPGEYEAMYYSVDGYNSKQRINALRREFYQENKEKINAQKRSAYEKQKERESSESEEINTGD